MNTDNTEEFLSGLLNSAGEWLASTGAEHDIVVSSRIRLARNLADFPFVSKLEGAKHLEIHDLLRDAIYMTGFIKPERYVKLDDCDEITPQFLVERHLISRELAEKKGPRGVGIGKGERLSIMALEEDHLRIQALTSGFQLKDSWELANEVDDALEKSLTYAYRSDLGYLTACPTNLGTGMRVSVMLHLPALVLTKQIEKVFHAVGKIYLAVRGLYGEGTDASGDFYQISNQVTLGRSEEEIIQTVESVIPQIVHYERMARETLLKRDRARLEDRVWRAYGVLANARMITSEETMMFLSGLRMGHHLGLLPDIDAKIINELFLFTQPAHLQKRYGDELETHSRDLCRANDIRSRLPKIKADDA